MATRGNREAGAGGTLPAEKVCQGDAWDDRASSPRLLDCERCGRVAAESVWDARGRTGAWRTPLFCDDCEAWWARMLVR